MKKGLISMLAFILALTYLFHPTNTKGIEANSDIGTSSSSHSAAFLSEETITIADEYIEFQTGPVVQYIITDQLGLRKALSKEDFQNVKNQIAEMNITLEEINREDLDNATVDAEGITFYEESQGAPTFEAASSKGINSFRTYWWGYNIYLNDHWTKTTYQMLYAGAGGAALYAKLSPLFSAPTAVLKAALYTGAAAGAGLAKLMQSENKGKGVRIRFTKSIGPLPGQTIPVWTGVFAQ